MTQKPKDQLDAEIARAEAHLPEARSRLLQISGVRYVTVGIKETGGQATQEVVFHVYVDRKKPLVELAPAERIPATAAGIGTDVIALHSEAHDVMVGGMKISSSFFGGFGTLGVICLAAADNTHAPANTPLMLTNHHVADDIGDPIGFTCVCDSWCCNCCDIGKVVDTALTNHVDGSIATLNTGVRFAHEILGIGAIRGQTPATLSMATVKYGAASGFTKGSVTSITYPTTRTDGAHFDNQIRIAPTAPSKVMSIPGDSGSVYLEVASNRIVGLNHAGDDQGVAIGNQIADVMTQLKITFPVIGTAGAIPLAAMPVEEDREAIEQVLALRRDLEHTEFGREWLNLMRAHSAEVRQLVNHHRTAKVAWQRCQGPAFIAHFVASARDRLHRVPRELGGMRLENAIISMAATLRQCGSPALAGAIAQHYLAVLECAQGADSASKALENAKRIAGGRPLSVAESRMHG
jgi:hypothetical protein